MLFNANSFIHLIALKLARLLTIQCFNQFYTVALNLLYIYLIFVIKKYYKYKNVV